MQNLYKLEEKAEAIYLELKAAYHLAYNNGQDIGYDAVTAANLRLNAIREQINQRDAEAHRIAKYDAIERNRLMLDDA